MARQRLTQAEQGLRHARLDLQRPDLDALDIYPLDPWVARPAAHGVPCVPVRCLGEWARLAWHARRQGLG